MYHDINHSVDRRNLPVPLVIATEIIPLLVQSHAVAMAKLRHYIAPYMTSGAEVVA